MFYQFYEWQHAAFTPYRAVADIAKLTFSNPANPLSHSAFGRSVSAGAELFERATRRYRKPEFGLPTTEVDGDTVDVTETVVWKKPFAQLKRFKRDISADRMQKDPKLLIVAPLSGHYATLLRGTVEAMMPHADVYITDWADARMVPITDGLFDLDDYIDYVAEMLRFLGPDVHVMGVCQPSVPVFAAVAEMNRRDDPATPASMILMGGPMDTRLSPTAVNDLASEKGIDWFRENVIMRVPWPHPGMGRAVYPGFLQLSGFMSMNLDRHMLAHKDFFLHLVQNDGESAEKHREFYDEYLAVLDLTAEFYLQTVQSVFIDHDLAHGRMRHHGALVDPKAITRTAIFTVEGENDDITGNGQTEACLAWCTELAPSKKKHYTQPAVGHYGVFNGSRFRKNIVPQIVDFMAEHGQKGRVPQAANAA